MPTVGHGAARPRTRGCVSSPTDQSTDRPLRLVAESRDVLVLDYFLFNPQVGPSGEPIAYGVGGLRPVASELRDALLARRRADPGLPILLIVDPINAWYGADLPPDLQALRDAGIDVVTVNLDPLRDSNALYSAAWRRLFKWWLQPVPGGGMLPNLLDRGGPPMSLAAVMRVLNFKANHRKLLITGDGNGSLRGIIGSANPHDASSAHSNVALYVEGPALAPLLASEYAIAGLSGWTPGTRFPPATASTVSNTPATPAAAGAPPPAAVVSDAFVAIATEGAIREALLERLSLAGSEAQVDIAMFYLSDRDVVEALVAAAKRGAAVRVLLDPNKDAFGFEKSGLPNRPVASELLAASDGAIRIRWYRTHGEQFHAKLAVIHSGPKLWFTLGSANFTRRNLADFNLEANVLVEADATGPLATSITEWFDMLWNNRAGNGIEFTADTEVYADSSQLRYWLYRVMEASGLSTF
jgi:phosphatidylserine/phosphatidylglycerophosphate/cardiolipin synthase-like enzyme